MTKTELIILPICLIILGVCELFILGKNAYRFCVEERKITDEEYEEKAKKGTCILLTCDQYLALHNADPKRYPLETEKLCGMLRHGKKIHKRKRSLSSTPLIPRCAKTTTDL